MSEAKTHAMPTLDAATWKPPIPQNKSANVSKLAGVAGAPTRASVASVNTAPVVVMWWNTLRRLAGVLDFFARLHGLLLRPQSVIRASFPAWPFPPAPCPGYGLYWQWGCDKKRTSTFHQAARYVPPAGARVGFRGLLGRFGGGPPLRRTGLGRFRRRWWCPSRTGSTGGGPSVGWSRGPWPSNLRRDG